MKLQTESVRLIYGSKSQWNDVLLKLEGKLICHKYMILYQENIFYESLTSLQWLKVENDRIWWAV